MWANIWNNIVAFLTAVGHVIKTLLIGLWNAICSPDQALVILKKAVVGLFPAAGQPWVSHILTVAVILAVFPGLFAFITWAERKLLARIQNRLGPNRVGPYGLFQPIADGLKMLSKEDIVPRTADQALHF